MNDFARFIAALYTLLFTTCAIAATTAPATRPVGDDPSLTAYMLKWSDEFDGDKLDTNRWVYRTDSKLGSTQKAENVSVSGGLLHLALKKETANGKHYTGAGIISKDTFKYGYYESRFKVPPGAGWHTSFWTMFHDGSGSTATKKAAQEIDICEQDSIDLRSYSAGVIAWADHRKNFGRQRVKTPDLSADFHIWGCEYTPSRTRFFFDGKLTHQTDNTFVQGDQHVWLTSIAIYDNKKEKMDDLRLPATADYDYVRVFEPTHP
jgi:beta-glucanase (GH16 family)